MENEPASLFVVPLGRTLSEIPPLGVVDKWLAPSGVARNLKRRGHNFHTFQANLFSADLI